MLVIPWLLTVMVWCVVALWAVLILSLSHVLQAHFGVPRDHLDRMVARNGMLIQERRP